MNRNIVFALTFSHFFSTLFLDFVATRSLFSETDLFTAGRIGILIFQKYNLFEIINQILCLFLLGQFIKKPSPSLEKTSQKMKVLIFATILNFIIILVYHFYLIPKITHHAINWENDLQNSLQTASFHQDEHYFHHKLYIIFDTIKMIILFISIVIQTLLIKDQERRI